MDPNWNNQGHFANPLQTTIASDVKTYSTAFVLKIHFLDENVKAFEVFLYVKESNSTPLQSRSFIWKNCSLGPSLYSQQGELSRLIGTNLPIECRSALIRLMAMYLQHYHGGTLCFPYTWKTGPYSCIGVHIYHAARTSTLTTRTSEKQEASSVAHPFISFSALLIKRK